MVVRLDQPMSILSTIIVGLATCVMESSNRDKDREDVILMCTFTLHTHRRENASVPLFQHWPI